MTVLYVLFRVIHCFHVTERTAIALRITSKAPSFLYILDRQQIPCVFLSQFLAMNLRIELALLSLPHSLSFIYIKSLLIGIQRACSSHTPPCMFCGYRTKYLNAKCRTIHLSTLKDHWPFSSYKIIRSVHF